MKADLEKTTNYIPEKLTYKDKLQILATDPLFQQGSLAATRTLLNSLFAIPDLLPAIGAASTLPSMLIKTVTRARVLVRVVKKVTGKNLSALDITPDVPMGNFIKSAVLEVPTAGLYPAQIIHTKEQYDHDKPRMVQAYQRARAILRA